MKIIYFKLSKHLLCNYNTALQTVKIFKISIDICLLYKQYTVNTLILAYFNWIIIHIIIIMKTKQFSSNTCSPDL